MMNNPVHNKDCHIVFKEKITPFGKIFIGGDYDTSIFIHGVYVNGQ
jgi:hypothetical protein